MSKITINEDVSSLVLNRFIQDIFIILFPFYPLWAWLLALVTPKPVGFFLTLLLLPIALYFTVYINNKLPKYLIFFLLFTFYHITSVFVNDTFPDDKRMYFILTDPNLLACLLFIIIEYTLFENWFITRMNKQILMIVIISLVVSLIQIKLPNFFYNVNSDPDLLYKDENRNFSIYSWTSLNAVGITFPILISILLSTFHTNKSIIPVSIFCGVIVSFLTRTRYVMISTVVVLSQLFFNTKIPVSKKTSIAFIFCVGLALLFLAAEYFQFDITEVVNARILEKDTDMASARVRLLSLDVFLIVFPENPWLGVGPETQKDVIDLLAGHAPIIHVGYLSYLYYYGVVGCSLLFMAIYFLLRDAWEVGKSANFWASFYGFISFCLANISFVYFNFSEMGIVLSTIYLRYYKNKG